MRWMFLFVVFSINQIIGQQIQWMTFAEARAAQEKEPKKNLYGCLYRLVRTL